MVTAPAAAAQVEIRVHFRAAGFRWKVWPSDVVELWQGDAQVGAVSGAWLHQVIDHALQAAALQLPLLQQLAAAAHLVPPPLPPELPPPPRKAPRKVLPARPEAPA